jgi:hypothetical protein
VSVSHQQPGLDIVISVRIFDNFQRMSMSNHTEVRVVIIFEGGGGGGDGGEMEENPPSLLMEVKKYLQCME